jgi:hypothetical protein
MDGRSLLKLIIIFFFDGKESSSSSLMFFDGMSFYRKQSQYSGEPHNITLKPWKTSIVEILQSQLWKLEFLVYAPEDGVDMDVLGFMCGQSKNCL